MSLPLTLEAREREYSPSSCIGGDYSGELREYAGRSEAALRAAPRHVELAYGEGPTHKLDLFLPDARPWDRHAPLLLFIHGGYWQELSKASSLFAATGCNAAGFAFAAVDYTLAPQASVREIALECRQALRWLHAHGGALGFDPRRILVAGSSAGAHLAALCCVRGWSEDADLPPAVPAAAVLVSGIYDLEPLVGTTINEALSLDAAAARAVSPLRLPLAGFPPTTVGWGEIETSEFKRQGRTFAQALDAAGVVLAPCIEVPGRNHFDVILDLAERGTPLGEATLSMLTSLANTP